MSILYLDRISILRTVCWIYYVYIDVYSVSIHIYRERDLYFLYIYILCVYIYISCIYIYIYYILQTWEPQFFTGKSMRQFSAWTLGPSGSVSRPRIAPAPFSGPAHIRDIETPPSKIPQVQPEWTEVFKENVAKLRGGWFCIQMFFFPVSPSFSILISLHLSQLEYAARPWYSV